MIHNLLCVCVSVPEIVTIVHVCAGVCLFVCVHVYVLVCVLCCVCVCVLVCWYPSFLITIYLKY